MAIDRMDWHYDSAAELFCRQTGKEAPEETDIELIERRAANHIGLFLMWLAKNDLLSADEGDADGIEKLKNEEMLGVDYLLGCIDGKFWQVDIAGGKGAEIEDKYNDYLELYGGWIDGEAYASVSTWDDYRRLEPLLDDMFGRFAI